MRKVNLLKNLKEAKGITLIALVTTVIVLLILAGVTINFMVGDNGIFRMARNIEETMKITLLKEKLQLSYLSATLSSQGGKVTAEVLEKSLNADGFNAVVEESTVYLDCDSNTIFCDLTSTEFEQKYGPNYKNDYQEKVFKVRGITSKPNFQKQNIKIITFKDSNDCYYVDESGDIREYNMISNFKIYHLATAKKSYVPLSTSRNVPKAFTVLECGILYATNKYFIPNIDSYEILLDKTLVDEGTRLIDDTFTKTKYGDAKKSIASGTSLRGWYTNNYNIGSFEKNGNNYVYQRGYAVIKNNYSGLISCVYTEPVSVTANILENLGLVEYE